MADLITRTELRNAGVSGTDDALDQAIAAASEAVRQYTDRDFGVANVTTTRRYEYDGSGFLDIDDATAVTAVTMVYDWGNYLVPVTEWRAQPYEGPVYTYIRIPGRWGVGSPEMGFRENADVLHREGRLMPLLGLVDVAATYGWPTVPWDVKQAAIWTAAAFKDFPGAVVSSESIAGYSRSFAIPAPPFAVPDRSKELLDPYVRLKV